jgi:leucyl-tRNA synthetase
MSATIRWATCWRATSDAGLQRAASDGLGRLRHAGRKRRDGKGVHPGGWTARQHRGMKAQLKRLGLSHRLEPRTRDLRAGILWPRAGAVPRFLQGGPRLSQGKRGQLGPGRHDRAGQRTGDRRARLAFGRAGRKAQADQWFLKITDFADDLLEGLGTLDRWPEKVRLMQENWIGKSKGLRCTFNLAGSAEGSRSSPPGPTRCSARASSRLPPTIRWRRQLAETPERCRRSSPSASAAARAAGDRNRREEGFDTGIASSIRSIPTGTCRSMSPISC